MTVALVNTTERAKSHPVASECLMQTGLRCLPRDEGRLAPYPEVQASGGDQEEVELRLLYRNRRVFAVGHGCAVDWKHDGQEAEWIAAEWLPSVLVPDLAVRPADASLPVLSIDGIAELEDTGSPPAWTPSWRRTGHGSQVFRRHPRIPAPCGGGPWCDDPTVGGDGGPDDLRHPLSRTRPARA